MAQAETLRIATFTTGLQAEGPGLLLHDLIRNRSPRAEAVAATIAHVNPDIVTLQGVDYDAGLLALAALADLIAERGSEYPHRFALPPNSGVATAHDMDGDGRTGRARDAQGYGRFAGQGGMAILSRLPIVTDKVIDWTDLLWKDLPAALGPPAGTADQAVEIQRLSSVAHWEVPLRLPSGRILTLMTWHATPPVFDGPEDRNGLRNHDEAALWLRRLDGSLGAPPQMPLVIIGNANLDPADGEGRAQALTALLAHPDLTDPAPRSRGGTEAAAIQGGVNDAHLGNPARDTADWSDETGPGNLRVSYILPSTGLTVLGSGVFWPEEGSPDATHLGPPDTRPPHRMVWVDIALP